MQNILGLMEARKAICLSAPRYCLGALGMLQQKFTMSVMDEWLRVSNSSSGAKSPEFETGCGTWVLEQDTLL